MVLATQSFEDQLADVHHKMIAGVKMARDTRDRPRAQPQARTDNHRHEWPKIRAGGVRSILRYGQQSVVVDGGDGVKESCAAAKHDARNLCLGRRHHERQWRAAVRTRQATVHQPLLFDWQRGGRAMNTRIEHCE